MGAAGHQGDLVAQFHVSPREPYRLSQIFDDSIPSTFISRGRGSVDASFRHCHNGRQTARGGAECRTSSSAVLKGNHGHRRFAKRLFAGPHHVLHLGAVSALLQGCRAIQRAGNRHPARHLVGAVRFTGAAVVEAPRLVAGTARASEENRRADDFQRADRQQLADLRLGGEQQPHGRGQPRLLHQPAGQCGTGPADPAGALASATVAGGGDGGARRRAATDHPGRVSLGIDRAGAELRHLRPAAQAGTGGGAAGAGG